MKKGVVLRRFVSIILLVGTLLGVFHHHHDLKSHTNCAVCILKHNIVNGDLPAPVEPTVVDASIEIPITPPIGCIVAEPRPLPPARAPPIG